MQINERQVGDVTILDLDGRLVAGDNTELLRDKVTSVVFQGSNEAPDHAPLLRALGGLR